MKNIKNALKIASVVGLIWSLKVISMDVVPMETSSSAPDIIPMETSSSAPAGTPAKKPAPSESQTFQEMAQRGSQYFPSILPKELVGMVDEYLYVPQVIKAIESAPTLAQALDNINKLSPDVLDKADKKLGEMLKEKFKDQIDLTDYIWTPLLDAARDGHEKKVKALLAAGADKDKVTRHGDTPLHMAAYWGYEKIVQELLNKGADKDKATQYTGATPLFIAAYWGHEKVVQELLNKGANIDKATNDGKTPLYAAAENGREKVVQVLLAAGANKSLSYQGKTALQIAKHKGYNAIVKMLE